MAEDAIYVGDGGAPKTRVFISYSRKDREFADRVCASLAQHDYQPFLDREDISGAEPWRERLEALILQADAVVFLISPDSIASHHCDWETKRTVELGKRLIPIVWRRIESGTAPPQLSRLNYIFLDSEAEFEAGMSRLCDACDVDIVWVREHTRLVDIATRWSTGGHNDDTLLRGDELSAAEAWLARRQPLAPVVPQQLLDFVQTSRTLQVAALERERAAIIRTRRLQWGVGSLIIVAAIVVIVAGLATARLMSNLGAARSRSLAEFAKQASDEGRYDRAARFALAGLSGADAFLTGFAASEAEEQLRRALASPLIGVLNSHLAPVRSVAFDQDGVRIVTASEDGTARIWDAANGRLLTTLEGEADDPATTFHEGIFEAQFSPDGRYVVTASEAGGAQIWNIAQHRAIVEMGDSYGIRRARFNARGDEIVTASAAGVASIWDISNITNVREVSQIATGNVTSAVLSPDSAVLLTTTGLRSQAGMSPAQTWNARNRENLRSFRALPAGTYNAVFDHDGRRVLTASDDGIARIWDARSGELIRELPALAGARQVAEFDRSGDLVATGSTTGTVRVWSIGRQREVALYSAHEGPVTAIAFNKDSTVLASASSDGTVRLWRVPSEREAIGLPSSPSDESNLQSQFSGDGQRILTFHWGAVRVWDGSGRSAPIVFRDFLWSNGAALSPDGRWIAVGGYETSAFTNLFDGNGRLVARMEGYRPVFSSDGTKVATSASNGVVFIWSLGASPHRIATCQPLPRLADANEISAEFLKFSPDGRRIITVYNYTGALLCDADTGEQIALLPPGILRGDFNRDASQLITVPSYGRAYVASLWRVGGATPRRVLQGHENEIFGASFSPDGARVITASADHTARIWDVRNESEPLVLRGHSGALSGAIFHPTLPLALTWSFDGTARLWSVDTGLEVARLANHSGGVSGAAFSADGRHVFTTETNGGSPRDWTIPDALSAEKRQLTLIACSTLLAHGASHFSEVDFRTAVVLDRSLDGDVCSPPSLLRKLRAYLFAPGQ